MPFMKPRMISSDMDKFGDARYNRSRFGGRGNHGRYWTKGQDAMIMATEDKRPDTVLAEAFGCCVATIVHRRRHLRKRAEEDRLQRIKFVTERLKARNSPDP